MTLRASMYEQAMGSRFERLHPALQRFHRLRGKHELSGWVETLAPTSTAAKLLARCLGTPLRSLTGAIRFELDAEADRETWTRHFPNRTMRSRLNLQQAAVVEKLGPVRLAFVLQERGGKLSMQLASMHFAGVPCPGWLMPRVVAEETGMGDRIGFEVSASVPGIGRVAGYHGHLLLPPAPP